MKYNYIISKMLQFRQSYPTSFHEEATLHITKGLYFCLSCFYLEIKQVTSVKMYEKSFSFGIEITAQHSLEEDENGLASTNPSF